MDATGRTASWASTESVTVDELRDANPWLRVLAVALLAAAVFVIDLGLPLGVACGVPYVVVALVALIWLNRRQMLVVAVACSVLTILGYTFSPAAGGSEPWKVLMNRSLALMAIWVTTVLGMQRKSFADALQLAKRTLAQRVEERTADLSAVVQQLSSEIAKRERSEQALRDSELRFSLLIEGVQEYAIFMLDPSGRVVSWNEGAERIYGYTAGDIVGESFSRLFHCPTDAVGECEVLLATAADAGSLQQEVTCVRRDRSHFLAYLVLTALFDDSGRLRGFAKVTRDTTQERRVQEKLMQAERLAAMADAMAGLAHESRNALQRSQASLERLARRLQGQPQVLKLIDNVQQAQDDLHRLYEEVREYAKPIRIQPQRHDVRDVLRDAWQQLAAPRKGRQVRLSEQFDGVELLCDIDAFAIRQVFRNILENSLAACGDPLELAVEYTSDLYRDHPALRIALRDNGPGLNLQQRERIFDAFYTTKTHGTGLGMAIARRTVEAHGGRIAANTRTDRSGTEILVTLPRRQVCSGH